MTAAELIELLKELGLPENHTEDIKYQSGEKEPNPNSSDQIKAWLFSLGWKPSTFKYVRDKNDYKKPPRQIPQIKGDGDGVCESVKRLEAKAPELEVLDGLSILTHRIGILEGFLRNVDDEGYIKAEIQGLTNTLRFKHTVVVNLPGVDKPYGKLIRGCLTSPEGYELCGSDMSSLEDRTKQHYMWDYDPEYVKEMLSPDFDPHLDIGVEAGMLTKEQSDAYKAGDKSCSDVRHAAKQVNYSCTYGVTPEGLERNTGMPIGDCHTLHAAYWKRNWAIEQIAENVEYKTVSGQKWLYNPVSGFWLSLRKLKDRFSTLNQSTGVYCFDTWLFHVRDGGPPVIGQMHDEWIALVKVGNRERMIKHVADAMDKTNAKLKLNRELGCDVQFGNDYSEIH